jgi:hypothetical protein
MDVIIYLMRINFNKYNDNIIQHALREILIHRQSIIYTLAIQNQVLNQNV